MELKNKTKDEATRKYALPKKVKTELDVNSKLFKDFTSYQVELDARNDKYERLVKLSRDITILSKRTIFCLLRKNEDNMKSIEEAEKKITEIKQLLQIVSTELTQEDPYKYLRSFSPGIQEFVEAVSLHYYMKHKVIISYKSTKELYFDSSNSPTQVLNLYDFVYGIADLTGELMRMAINSVGSHDFSTVEEICGVLRSVFSEFSGFNSREREMNKKITTMKNSLRKVENACYALKIRGSEIPEHLLSDIFKSESDN